jgi:hypothetical protein
MSCHTCTDPELVFACTDCRTLFCSCEESPMLSLSWFIFPQIAGVMSPKIGLISSPAVEILSVMFYIVSCRIHLVVEGILFYTNFVVVVMRKLMLHAAHCTASHNALLHHKALLFLPHNLQFENHKGDVSRVL